MKNVKLSKILRKKIIPRSREYFLAFLFSSTFFREAMMHHSKEESRQKKEERKNEDIAGKSLFVYFYRSINDRLSSSLLSRFFLSLRLSADF